jgi:hypothetical protein
MKTIIDIAKRSGLRRSGLIAAITVALVVTLVASVKAIPQPASHRAPPALQGTGLYADFAKLQVDARHLPFSPQYPLWTDGATKRRWISLPSSSTIDASDPDAWTFPIGTRLWKEFSFAGRRVETRYMERQPDGRWLYAAYAWSEDGRDTQLVSERGRRNAYPLADGQTHTIPSVSDCKVCHQGSRAEVLGFSALQLSPLRDPGAPHADPSPAGVDLYSLVENGLLSGLPQSPLETPPSIVAASAAERAALGYLHGNCGHCHNEQGPLRNVGLFLRQTTAGAVPSVIASTFNHPVKKPSPGLSPDAIMRIEPQHPYRSALLQRVASRSPALQMPPLGTELVDHDAVDLLQRWIAQSEPVSRPLPLEPKGDDR